MTRLTIFVRYAIVLWAVAGPPGAAQETDRASDGAADSALVSAPITRFIPADDRTEHRIDYSFWSDVLEKFVVSMGPPLRRNPNINGKMPPRFGHNSLYRLDGSMFAFSFVNEPVIEAFSQYRRDLEGVADTLDIPSLPRNEQLAYWLNLHNVALVEQIAKAWPARLPRKISIEGVPLDAAKIVTINGVPLSARDIRTRIVYPNWKDPRVIYGFWRGEIGGPAIRRKAFHSNSVSDMLDRAAKEFINSRRGTEKRGKTMHVSTLYAEAAQFYFPDLERDLRSHLLKFTDEEITKRLAKTERFKLTLRERDIADLAGGTSRNAYWPREQVGAGVIALMGQRSKKFDFIERKGLRTGEVIFTEIELPGSEANSQKEIE